MTLGLFWIAWDSWLFLGTPDDSWGLLKIFIDSWSFGHLQTLKDSLGFLGSPEYSSKLS